MPTRDTRLQGIILPSEPIPVFGKLGAVEVGVGVGVGEISVGAISLLVIVQVLVSPAAIVPEQSTEAVCEYPPGTDGSVTK